MFEASALSLNSLKYCHWLNTSPCHMTQNVSSTSYVSQFTVETYCFADGRCLFKQPQSVVYHWNQYDEESSKKCRSVRPFVTLTKKAYSSFIIDSRKIICISGKRVWHPLEENEAKGAKKYFSKILEWIFEKFCTCIKCPLLHCES